jgi:molecular chaperone DnaK (HSP70)
MGDCVYSTLVDDQESMILDIYEGERPHVKFCRYLGEVTILGLPRGRAGQVKIKMQLKMNEEGLLDVTATNVQTNEPFEAIIDANPDELNNSDEVNEYTDMDPIEAERYHRADYDLVLELEHLDDYISSVSEKYRTHVYGPYINEKLMDTKEWLYRNKRKVTIEDCVKITQVIKKFLTAIDEKKIDKN